MWKWQITAWGTTGFSLTCPAGALKTRLSGRSMQVCLKSANDQMFNLISKIPFWCNVDYRKQGPHSPIDLTLPIWMGHYWASAWVSGDVWSWGKLILLAEILPPNKSSFCRIVILAFSFVLIRRTLFKSNSRSFRRNRRPYCFAC